MILKRYPPHVFRTTARWALLSAALSALLLCAAGTTRIPSLRAYFFAFAKLDRPTERFGGNTQ